MERREFFKSGVLGAAGLALASTPLAALSSCTKKPGCNTELKLSFQEGTALGDTLDEKFDYMESLGIAGFEPGGQRLVNDFDKIQNALQGRNIKVSAICAGFQGFILAEDSQKELFDTTMREIVAAAGAIGSTGVIMVPAFNGQQPCLPHTQATRDYLCEELAKLGEFALENNTNIILEPLNRKECFYLRLVADAAAICRDTNCKGVKCMGDFWHMQEETSDYAAFMAAGSEYLQHVHIASRGCRAMPGEDGKEDNYVDGFRALQEIGYDKYVSFECGCLGTKSKSVPAAVALLREQWALARK